MKKIILSIGSIIISSTSVISLLSCGKTKVLFTKSKKLSPEEIIRNKVKDLYKNNYYRPFQFKELKEIGKNQPLMNGGIGQFAYSHGMSFIINVLRKIGFDLFENDAKKNENGKIININYYQKKDTKKDVSSEKDIIAPTIINKRTYNKTPLENDINPPTQIGFIFNFIRATPIDENGNSNVTYEVIKENLDTKTPNKEITFKISGFQTKIENHAEKVFALFNWNSRREDQFDYQISLNHDLNEYGSGYISSDPLGIDGYPNSWVIWSNGIQKRYIFTENEMNRYEWNFKDINNREKKRMKWYKSLETYKRIQSVVYGIPKFYEVYDGENPGSRIFGMEIGNYDEGNDKIWNKIIKNDDIQKNKKWNFTFSTKSRIKWIQTFNIIDKNTHQEKIDEIKELIKTIIKNLYYQLKYMNSDIVNKYISIVHPTIKNIFNFIKNLNINDPTIWENIDRAVEELNNGSHSFLAVEIFARGIENLPVRYAPVGNGIKKEVPETGTINLIGMANSTDFQDLLSFVHTPKKGYGEKGNKSKEDGEIFDLHNWKTIIKDAKMLKTTRRPGETVKKLGGLVNREIYKKWWKENKDIYSKWLQDVSKWESGSKEAPKPILKYKSNLKFIEKTKKIVEQVN